MGVQVNNILGGGLDVDISLEVILRIPKNGLGVVLGRGQSG